MNAKLEVIRVNEDVIATSGICAHLNANHMLYTKDDAINDNNCYYSYDSTTGKLNFVRDVNDSEMPTYSINSGGWWHFKSGAGWVKCEEQSNDAHPRNPD